MSRNTPGIASPDDLFAVAEKVAGELTKVHVASGLIGAAAMAIHGYARSTDDVDLGISVDPSPVLSRVARELISQGLDAEYFDPEPEDPLGGVIRIWLTEESTIDVVNFLNPWHGGAAELAKDALAQATPADAGSALRVIPLAHLIGLKLYAGGAKSLGDVEELLRANPTFPRGSLPQFLARYGLGTQWERVAGLLKL